MKDKQKIYTCAALLAVSNMGQKLPERVDVQRFKTNNPEPSLEGAINTFAAPYMESDEHEKMWLAEAKSWAKELRKIDDAEMRKLYPHVHEVYAEMAGGVFTSKLKPEHAAPKKPAPKPVVVKPTALLATLNGLLKLQKKPPLKKWKASRDALEKRIDATRKAIESHKPETKAAPTVVAEGAYKTEEEAFARTGHRTSGKTKKMIKDEKRKARFIEKRVGPSTHTLKASEIKMGRSGKTVADVLPPKNRKKGDFLSLADVARTMGIQPKVARGKARRYKKELAAFEVGGKYKYALDAGDKIKKILEGDGRKK